MSVWPLLVLMLVVCVCAYYEWKKCRQSYISQITIKLSSKCPTFFFRELSKYSKRRSCDYCGQYAPLASTKQEALWASTLTFTFKYLNSTRWQLTDSWPFYHWKCMTNLVQHLGTLKILKPKTDSSRSGYSLFKLYKMSFQKFYFIEYYF